MPYLSSTVENANNEFLTEIDCLKEELRSERLHKSRMQVLLGEKDEELIAAKQQINELQVTIKVCHSSGLSYTLGFLESNVFAYVEVNEICCFILNHIRGY